MKYGTFFLTPPNAASTAITGRNAKPPRPASVSNPSTTASIVRRPGGASGDLLQLGPHHIEPFVAKWLERLPRPLTATTPAAGYDYDISVLQSEFSLTGPGPPAGGAGVLREVIRDTLDAGRADQVSLIFDRTVRTRGKHPTPGQSAPGSSPTESPRRSTSTTRTPGSNSISSLAMPSARKRPSTTPPISVSAADCTTIDSCGVVDYDRQRPVGSSHLEQPRVDEYHPLNMTEAICALTGRANFSHGWCRPYRV